MNAAIRAATREALARGVQVSGIQHGFAGRPGKNTVPLTARAVGGIIQRGGTMPGSARCDRFRTEEGVREGAETLRSLGIEGLVVSGGNGSQAGAMNLANEGIPVVGCLHHRQRSLRERHHHRRRYGPEHRA
ncbi:hypothetical protein BH20VER1_BH20VER1_22490 [soil metagenome]